jgi:DNA-binding HxlR family transcriptional regulator
LRAGAYGLSLLSDPLDAQILQALENGPLPLIDVRRAVGLPPETTLRKHLKALTQLGLLIRTQSREFPAPVSYELSASGSDLRLISSSVEFWLTASPAGPLALGLPVTKTAIKSLVDAWSTKMVRALAAKPLSLTDLDRVLAGINYPALERRLSAMRLAGQVEAAPGQAGSTPYRITRWLREAVGPLVAAADWEARHYPDVREPLERADVEAIFLLALPLMRLPKGCTGSCRLLVTLPRGSERNQAGAVVTVEQGVLLSCASDLNEQTSSAVVGSGDGWLATLCGEAEGELALTGDTALATALVSGLQRVCESKSFATSPGAAILRPPLKPSLVAAHPKSSPSNSA